MPRLRRLLQALLGRGATPRAGLPTELAAWAVAATAVASGATGCAGPGVSALETYRTVDARTGRRIELDELADRLAEADVVFLGELHTSALGHALQLELTRRLADRRGAVLVSLEMFERDVQPLLDDYLAGEVGEAEFLAGARPWKDYERFYRPAVEWARRTDRSVLAANLPRALARTVAREGVGAVEGSAHLPAELNAEPGAYRDRFLAVVGGHGDLSPEDAERWFRAQCLKDDAMAESLAEWWRRQGSEGPLAVHWCGRFHSDYGLGTVERLRRRLPELEIRVVTMVEARDVDRELTGAELAAADFVWVVKEGA